MVIGSVKGVTGFSLDYSKDGNIWQIGVMSINSIRDTGTFKVPFTAQYGFYRGLAEGRNEYSKVFFVFDPLPINFTDWKLERKVMQDILSWKVENESNIKKYLISRSTDGVHFTYVEEVQANGSTYYRVPIKK